MDVREKLVELLDRFVDDDWYSSEEIAERLIANGVTVQRWIPVTERLPEQYESVIVWTIGREVGEAEYDGKQFRWAYDDDYANVTHWMPLPEPPKEDAE